MGRRVIDPADWGKTVRASYGMSLDELVEEHLGATECPSDLTPAPRLECDAPALTAAPAGNFAWTHSLYCDDPEVIGGIHPQGEPTIIGERGWSCVGPSRSSKSASTRSRW